MLKTLILTQKSNQSDFRRKLWLFYVCMTSVMRKTQINVNRFFLEWSSKQQNNMVKEFDDF